MTPDERDRVMARLLAVWPSPAMGDATRIVWNEFLVTLSGPRSLRALDMLQRTSRHRPAQSDFWECYLAEGPDNTAALPRPECFVCEDGWVKARRGLARCPNGCLPPTAEERRQMQIEEERIWDEEHAKRKAAVAQEVKTP